MNAAMNASFLSSKSRLTNDRAAAGEAKTNKTCRTIISYVVASDLMALLDDARREVVQKSRAQIEEETAWKWAARAAASYQLFIESGRQDERRLRDTVEYQHEAIEHGAMADHSGHLLARLRAWMHQYVPRDL